MHSRRTISGKGLPFVPDVVALIARHSIARKSLPEFLNNMLAWMVPLLKLFTKLQIFFATSRKRNNGPCAVCHLPPAGAAVASGALPEGEPLK
jgi:hypothetical protein